MSSRTGETAGDEIRLYAPTGQLYVTTSKLEANNLRSQGYGPTKPRLTAEVREQNAATQKRTSKRQSAVQRKVAAEQVAQPLPVVPDGGPTAT